jgi:pimeloyl-ACP methyl ester carboxylesterase
MIHSKKVCFIHGMFMNPSCWDGWVEYFTSHGYECEAPPWPCHESSIEELNASPDARLGDLTLKEVITRYSSMLSNMDEQPILIGHSMGGLIVQLLLNQGLGNCGIAIDHAPPAGVFSFEWSFLRSNLPTVNPLAGNKPARMSFPLFRYAFANGIPEEGQQMLYERYICPESRNVPRSSTGAVGKIHFRKTQAPLLIIAGQNDHIIPASLNRKTFNQYQPGSSVVDFKEFEGRNHCIIIQKEWHEVAAYCRGWVEGL